MEFGGGHECGLAYILLPNFKPTRAARSFSPPNSYNSWSWRATILRYRWYCKLCLFRRFNRTYLLGLGACTTFCFIFCFWTFFLTVLILVGVAACDFMPLINSTKVLCSFSRSCFICLSDSPRVALGTFSFIVFSFAFQIRANWYPRRAQQSTSCRIQPPSVRPPFLTTKSFQQPLICLCGANLRRFQPSVVTQSCFYLQIRLSTYALETSLRTNWHRPVDATRARLSKML
jgi:hypothetical protein